MSKFRITKGNRMIEGARRMSNEKWDIEATAWLVMCIIVGAMLVYLAADAAHLIYLIYG